MTFRTNALKVQAFAGALFGVQVGTTTMAQVNADITSNGGLANTLNGYYASSFGNVANATVAASVAANLGLTGDALASGTAYITAQLNGAAAGARGAVISNILDLFAGLASDATFGAAATAWNAKVDAANAYTGAANVTIGSTAGQGSAFTLTTGVDSFAGTAGNDSFNAVLSGTAASNTFNSFDNIAGGTGTDTLNIASDVTGEFAMPASLTVSGMEVVNLSRSGATGAADVTVTNSTFGAGVQSFSLVNAGANTTGPVAVTLNSATSVSVASTGTAFTTVAVTDTSTTAASTGSTLKTVTITKATGANTLTGNGITTVNLNAAGGLTTVTAAAGARELTVNASGTTTQGGLTDAQATSATLNVTGTSGSAHNFGTLTVAKATTVNVNTNAAATTAVVAAAATTLNLGGTGLNTLTAGADNVALTTINVTGSGGVTSDVSAVPNLATIDLSTSTAAAPASGVLTGANTFTVGVNTAVTGGAGQDRITVGATNKAIDLGAGNDIATVSVTALGALGSINGGDGTDTLKLSNANAVTLSTANATQTAFRAAVTGFETLDITEQAGSTIALGGAGTFTTVKFASANAAQVFSGATTGLTVESTFAAAGGTVTLNNITGASDVINISLKGDLSSAARAFGTFATPGAETVNIAIDDSTAVTTGTKSTLTLTNANATTINVSGDNGLDLTHTGTALTTFNASGVTKGGVILTSGALTTDAVVTGSAVGGDTLNFASSVAKVNMTATAGTNALTGSSTIANTITGGTGADTIVGGNGVDTISGGGGTDTITGGKGNDVMTGGANADTFVFDAAAAVGNHSAIGGFDTITDFVAGTDKLQFTNRTDVVSAQQTAVQTAVTALASSATAAQIANAMANANTTDLGVAFATFGGDTYVLFEATGANTTFTVADDIFIKLTGVTTLPTFAADVTA
jgi:S-layer protein